MRILLLHPHNFLENYHYAIPQVALGYLCSALKKAGFYDVHIKDALLHKWTVTDVENYVKKLGPQVIGIRVWSHQINVVNQYIQSFKKINPSIKIILGGPHITVDPDFYASNPFVDYSIQGEAEQSLPALLKIISNKSEVGLEEIPGIIYKKRNHFELVKKPPLRSNEINDYSVDWESLQLMDYHKLNSRTTAYDNGKKKNAFIFTTRGCPYPCTYCAAGIANGKKIRSQSALKSMDEVQYLYDKYGIHHFNIMDDNFTFYKDHVMEFCEEFLRRKNDMPNISFHNPNGVRVDRLDDEMLNMMAKCGWKWLHIGIESASPKTLLRMKKRLDIKLAKENITKIRSHGMKVWGFFILGFFEETKSDMEETIDFSINSDLTAATFSLFSPIPGTDIYKELLQKGLISSDYLMSGYMSSKTQIYAKNVTADELHKITQKALLRFYSRPDRAYHLLNGMSFETIQNRIKTLFFNKKVFAQ